MTVRLEDLLIEIHEIFNTNNISHQFGGILALNYYFQQRATEDIDINTSVPVNEIDRITNILAELGIEKIHQERLIPDAGIRYQKEWIKVDIFPSFDRRHNLCKQRAVMQQWRYSGGTMEIPFLSLEDIIIFKISFGRPKDWLDLENLVQSQNVSKIDIDYIEKELVAFKGKTIYPRFAHFNILLKKYSFNSKLTTSRGGCGQIVASTGLPCLLRPDHKPPYRSVL